MKSLIESVRAMYAPRTEATMMKDDGKMVHNCAKHVEHAEYGKGSCIAEEHADPDRYGNIAWYDVEFPHGVERGVPVNELKVLQSESHGHMTKKKKKVAEELENAPKDLGGDAGKQADKKKKFKDAETAADKTSEMPGAAEKGAKIKEDIEHVDEKFGGTQNMLNQTTHKNNDPMRRLKVTTDHPRFANKPLNSTSQNILKKRLKNDQGTHSKPNLPEEVEEVDEVVHVYRQDADRDRGPLHSKHSAPYREVNQKSRDQLAKEVKSARKSGAFKVTTHASVTGHSGKTYTQKTAGGLQGSKLHVMGLKNMKANEEVEVEVDETIIHRDLEYTINEADKNYDTYFKAKMKANGGMGKTEDEKKAFFKKVDAGYKAKNEETFVEAFMHSDLEDVKNAHKKSGNRITDEKSGTREGKPHHSFVVTTPEGKRTRHIYHGSSKKLETMSPAKKSKQSQEQDLDD
jgi:2-oxo-4-hydroxy-4-carboxy--5-ureidoimidazoline (OHCU) decarboxylase